MHQSYGWEKNHGVTSIYFGGGTPSLTSNDDLQRILEKIQGTFSVKTEIEITLEINPEDVTAERIAAWKATGINRFSLGLEAMQDDQLRRLGRAGTLADNLRALDYFAAAEVNLSVDLIFGLEHQTLENWMQTLEKVIVWNPQHISAYNLTIEEKTKYWVEVKQNTLVPPPDETNAEMFLQGRAFLQTHGYAAYEISNFAKPGFESQHNQSYWTGQNYWGLGVAAHSLQRTSKNEVRRFWNPKSIQSYLLAMEKSELAIETEILPLEKHFSERVMVALRTSQGANLPTIESDLNMVTPATLKTYFDQKIRDGFLRTQGADLVLTEKGLLFSDDVFLGLF